MNKPLDTIRPPWVFSPYSLLTWWEMEKFSAAAFYDFGARLAGARKGIDETFDTAISADEWKKSGGYKTLKKLYKQCQSIDLKVSAMSIDDFLKSTRTSVSTKSLGRALSEIENTIRREMSIVQFFYMPREQADHYRKNDLFGPLVATKYPALSFDIVEAGNCYAVGRGTACVFHLMRIMEVGTQEFGTALGVTFTDKKNWHNILDESNKAIKGMPVSPKTVVLNQIASQLHSVRVAWRNQVMHPHDKYTLDEAKELIDHVRAFMKALAKLP